MKKHDGYCIIAFREQGDEMDVEVAKSIVDGGLEMRKRVDMDLVFPPAEVGLPVVLRGGQPVSSQA